MLQLFDMKWMEIYRFLYAVENTRVRGGRTLGILGEDVRVFSKNIQPGKDYCTIFHLKN